MPDSRFFSTASSLSLEELAEIANCNLVNKNSSNSNITGINSITEAGPEELTFLSNKKYAQYLPSSKAGACVLHKQHLNDAPKHMALLVSNDPYVSFAKIAKSLYPDTTPQPNIAQTSFVDNTAKIGSNCTIEPGVFIGPNAQIGDNCFIAASSYINQGVIIGNNCRISHNSTISHAKLGNNIIIHPGVRIGQDGFGFATEHGVHLKIPQLGRVIIEDNVEIGSNSCIDRGAGPDTIIGEGTKIDNLVQIAHNAQIGKGCIIVAQVGISGSTKLGDYVVLGGQVGVVGHIEIASGSQVAAKSGVMQSIKERGNYGGIPALPITKWHRQTALLKKLIKKKG